MNASRRAVRQADVRGWWRRARCQERVARRLCLVHAAPRPPQVARFDHGRRSNQPTAKAASFRRADPSPNEDRGVVRPLRLRRRQRLIVLLHPHPYSPPPRTPPRTRLEHPRVHRTSPRDVPATAPQTSPPLPARARKSAGRGVRMDMERSCVFPITRRSPVIRVGSDPKAGRMMPRRHPFSGSPTFERRGEGRCLVHGWRCRRCQGQCGRRQGKLGGLVRDVEDGGGEDDG